MEFLSQFDVTIRYLPGDRNNVADALSRLPDNGLTATKNIVAATLGQQIRSMLQLEDALPYEIKAGYTADPFTVKLESASPGMHTVSQTNGFWFVDNRLFIPNVNFFVSRTIVLATSEQ
jgi:hypothetical protein